MIPETILQTDDILIVSGKGLLSRAIDWFTDSKWSHVALFVGDEGNHIIEATSIGVMVNDLQTLCKGHTDICVRRYAGLSTEQLGLIKDKAYSLVYEPYDYIQLLSLGTYNLFRKIGIKMPFLVRNARDRMICSELIAVAYSVVDIDFAKRIKLVTPAGLHDDTALITIYEAKI